MSLQDLERYDVGGIPTYNQFHNILRLFDDLPNFPFATSETMGDYYLQTWYIRVGSRVAEPRKTQGLSKLGNIRKLSKPHEMKAQCPARPPSKMNAPPILAENRNQKFFDSNSPQTPSNLISLIFLVTLTPLTLL